MLKVNSLKKYFGQTKAVDDISFEIGENEIFGFLGPNGAGKSTTIRCIVRLLFPTSGDICVLGENIKKDNPDIRKKIGYMGAELSLNDNWTGLDHIELVRSLKGKGENDQKILQDLNLNVRTKVRNLSTGNKQKLALYLTLIGSPSLLILDEPTRGLDPLVQAEVHSILLDFKKNGGSILISSHDLTEVDKLCDRVGIIKNGKFVNVGETVDLKGKNIYTINLAGDVNFILEDFRDPSISVISHSGQHLNLKVQGDINPLLKVLPKYNLSSIQITQASLEEIFLQFYQ